VLGLCLNELVIQTANGKIVGRCSVCAVRLGYLDRRSILRIYTSTPPDYAGAKGTLVASEIGKSPYGFYLYNISIT
jgi:hypothetical protein